MFPCGKGKGRSKTRSSYWEPRHRSWLPPSDDWLSITDSMALFQEIWWLCHRRIFKKKKEDEQYSTPYTLLDLDYDTYDVIDRLKELTIKDYSETLIDRDDINPPLLFVFGKDINNKQVYVKLKIKRDQSRYVLCVSFHYAKEKMLFPYA